MQINIIILQYYYVPTIQNIYFKNVLTNLIGAHNQ